MGEHAAWKWVALALLLVIWLWVLRILHCLVRRHPPRLPFLRALADLLVAGFILISAPVLAHFALIQIYL